MTLPKAVEEIGQLNFDGNIIPHTWYQHLTYDNGKPNVNAIIILSDILYWYRPTVIRNETTGQIKEVRKKFAADKLQRNYSQISEQFGFTKKQARDAINFLVEKGYITKELRTVSTKTSLKMSQVMYLEPIVNNIKLINTPAQVTSDDLQVISDDSQVITDIPISHTYTETTAKTTPETTAVEEPPPKSKILPIASKLKELTGYDKVYLTDDAISELNETTRWLFGVNATVTDLEHFMTWWWGKTPPTMGQLKRYWSEAMAQKQAAPKKVKYPDPEPVYNDKGELVGTR